MLFLNSEEFKNDNSGVFLFFALGNDYFDVCKKTDLVIRDTETLLVVKINGIFRWGNVYYGGVIQIFYFLVLYVKFYGV